jgi:hypothetical protein
MMWKTAKLADAAKGSIFFVGVLAAAAVWLPLGIALAALGLAWLHLAFYRNLRNHQIQIQNALLDNSKQRDQDKEGAPCTKILAHLGTLENLGEKKIEKLIAGGMSTPSAVTSESP